MTNKNLKLVAFMFLLPPFIQGISIFNVCVGDTMLSFCKSNFLKFIFNIAPFSLVIGIILLFVVLWKAKKDQQEQNTLWKKDISIYILVALFLTLLFFWMR